jgi:hypothetical protein
MTFLGAVDRLGIPGSGSAVDEPIVLFAFEDTLIFAELRRGPFLALGLFRHSDEDQRTMQEILVSKTVTPESVLLRWPKARVIATADIRKARLSRSILGAFYGTRKLTFDLEGDRTHAVWAIRTSREPLRRILVSVLGERFESG